jgi:hypothetical protein
VPHFLCHHFSTHILISHYVKKSPIFWNILPCSPLKVNQQLRWICCLHTQGQRLSHARNADFTALYIISQKMGLFITTAVRSSNLTLHSTFTSSRDQIHTFTTVTSYTLLLYSENFKLIYFSTTNIVKTSNLCNWWKQEGKFHIRHFPKNLNKSVKFL